MVRFGLLSAAIILISFLTCFVTPLSAAEPLEVVVEGPQQACEALLGKLRGANTPGGVDTVTYQLSDARGTFRGFNER